MNMADYLRGLEVHYIAESCLWGHAKPHLLRQGMTLCGLGAPTVWVCALVDRDQICHNCRRVRDAELRKNARAEVGPA